MLVNSETRTEDLHVALKAGCPVLYMDTLKQKSPKRHFRLSLVICVFVIFPSIKNFIIHDIRYLKINSYLYQKPPDLYLFSVMNYCPSNSGHKNDHNNTANIFIK